MGHQSACEPEPAEGQWAELYGRPIEELQFSTRPYNRLKNAGIDTIGELAGLTEQDLLGLRNLGVKSLGEINEKLRQLAVDPDAVLKAGRVAEGNNRVGHQSACEPEPAEGQSTSSEFYQRPIEVLQFSTRPYNSLKNAGIDTIGELAGLTEEDLLGLRNLGVKSLGEINEKLQQLAVNPDAFSNAGQVRHAPAPLTSMQAKRARKSTIGEAVLDAVKARVGRAAVVEEIHDEVTDRLGFVPEEDEVREALRSHAKTTGCFVKVARNAYAWAPDGEIPPPPAPPHVADMIERRWRGETLDEIGDVHGVTRERIRQLIKKYGGPTAEDVRERRAALELEEQREREDAMVAALRAALEQRGPMTVLEVAELTGYDPVEVSKGWPSDLSYLRLRAAGTYQNQWSDEAILDAIRDAALYEFPLTTNAYAQMLSQGQVHGPSMPRIWQRFGSWTAACEAAGVVPGQTMRPHYESRWSNDDLLQIARQYLLDPSAPNSAGRFDEWRRSAVPDGPSFQTLRNRFGSWTEVKRRALAQEGGKT